jgi:DNA-binding Lrp family transcriptional regulator
VVLKSLLNGVQRKILFATLDRARSIEEISRDCGIPMSTCYVKVSELVSGGVLRREKEGLTRNRKVYALYRATIRTIILGFDSEGLDVVAVENGDEPLKPFQAPAPLVAIIRRRADR